MRSGIYYDFKHIAIVPWPWVAVSDQSDWIDSLFTLEEWLNTCVGREEWAYSNNPQLEYWQACVAFKRERNKTLFLLRWSA
jgi:hypothetical protein